MHDADKQLFISILKQHGHSQTAGRLLVFKTLWHQPPVEIGDLYRKLQDKLDRASLYRTVKLFEQIGVIHRVSMGWKYKIELAEAFSQHHHHLTCAKCGRIIAVIEDEAIEERIRQLAVSYKVKLTTHQLEVQGICAKCQRAEP